MRLSYTVGDAGWADIQIECGGVVIEMAASYLHDSLLDLLSATTAIASGAQEAKAIFMDEPGEHHLNLRRIDDQCVGIEVRWYDDWQSWGIGSSTSSVVLQCETRLAHLRGQVLSAARKIVEEVGPAEYRARWQEHDFPAQQLADLERTRG